MRVTVTAKGQDRRYRSGLCFTAEPLEVDSAELGEEAFAAIKSDPHLQVKELTNGQGAGKGSRQAAKQPPAGSTQSVTPAAQTTGEPAANVDANGGANNATGASTTGADTGATTETGTHNTATGAEQ